MIVDRIYCLIFGHGRSRKEPGRLYNKFRCSRCNAVVEFTPTYFGNATRYSQRYRIPGKPVRSLKYQDSTVNVGDKLAYTELGAFPGIRWPRIHRIEYLFEDPHGFMAKVRFREEPISSRDAIGVVHTEE